MTRPAVNDGSPGAERADPRWLIGAAVLIAAFILTLELFVPPVIGIANNGDFEKVTTYVRIQYLTEDPKEKYWDYAVTQFGISPRPLLHSGYHTSETFLAAAARPFGAVVCPAGRFDIRALGAIHTLLLLAAIGLLLRAAAAGGLRAGSRVLAAVLCVFVFTDVAYAAPFNSFYSQTASLLFFLLTAAVAGLGIAGGRLSGIRLYGYFLFAALFIVSKPQECIHGLVLACLGVWLASRGSESVTPGREGWRVSRPAALLALVLIGGSYAYYRTTPRADIHDVGLYHSFFVDLLPSSPDPGRDMDEFGVDRALLRYSGRHAYLPDSPLHNPNFQRQFFDHVSYPKLMVFYVRHPDRMLDRIRRAAPSASKMRPFLGNFEKKDGLPRAAMANHFDWWSTPKKKTYPFAFPLFSIFFAATLAACAVGLRRAGPRERLFRISLAALVVMALMEFFVCAFADFLGDLPRHLYSFHAMADLILIADLVWIAERLSRRTLLRRNEMAHEIAPARP